MNNYLSNEGILKKNIEKYLYTSSDTLLLYRKY